MNSKCLISIFVLTCITAFSGTTAFAQRISDLPHSPDSYFNSSAYLYTDEKTDLALQHVNQGLEKYPNNVKLIKLKELLEKQQEQEQQQQQQQDQQDQNKDKQDQQDQQQNQDQQNKDQQQDQDKEDQKKDEQKKDQQEQQQDQQDQQQQQAQPKTAEEMTREEAKMLLDAMRNEEKAQRDAMRIIMGEPEPPQNGKDW